MLDAEWIWIDRDRSGNEMEDEMRGKNPIHPSCIMKEARIFKRHFSMKKNAESDKPFTLNKHVREWVNQWII
jgi:hypothetical protein